jgi:hypothetical protein
VFEQTCRSASAYAFVATVVPPTASTRAQAAPMSILVRPRLRRPGWAGASFIFVLPPRERWQGGGPVTPLRTRRMAGRRHEDQVWWVTWIDSS